MDRKELGIKGEDLAVVLLENRGYEIVARNYITKMGEIDIIAFKDRVLVFCEVKTRAAGIFGEGREAVDELKQQKIRKCAERFILTTGFKYDYIEFHVIEITIEHLKECF
ncbi:MAG: YraN family protein [Firmicutes bacterium]|nr:YraN family protein [Bacillota bacterium]